MYRDCLVSPMYALKDGGRLPVGMDSVARVWQSVAGATPTGRTLIMSLHYS